MNKLVLLFFVGLTVFSFGQENQVDSKGKKQGYWKKYFPNTSILDYQGFFKDDIPDGEFIYYFKNGKIKAKMIFKEKGLISYTTMHHDDDNNFPIASGKFINKVKDSIWNYWGPSGGISMTETYKNGVLHGKKIVYYVPEFINQKKIIIAQELNYVDGLKDGEQKDYFDNGVLKVRANYSKDKKTGQVLTYTPAGVLEMKDNYVNGLKEGWCYFYDSSGKEVEKAYYRLGNKLDEKETKAYLEKFKK
jgi:antitoxin component YwqK of YwqJK toxin-antitoxin module